MTWRANLLAVALVLALGAPAAPQGLYLHVLSTTTPQGQPSLDGSPWPVALSIHHAQTALENLPASLDAVEVVAGDDPSGLVTSQKVWLWVGDDEVVGGDAEARYLKATFVVDFHDAAVVALSDRLLEQQQAAGLTGRPSIDAIARLTHDSIGDKTLARGWDFASRIARHGEGDCTEHAVLLTALARSFGYPARVMVGLALTVPSSTAEAPDDAGAAAYGHAWAEIHDGDRWRAVDATQIEQEPGVAVRLLPLQVFDNEGPGYAMATIGLLHTFPKHVEILRSPP